MLDNNFNYNYNIGMQIEDVLVYCNRYAIELKLTDKELADKFAVNLNICKTIGRQRGSLVFYYFVLIFYTKNGKVALKYYCNTGTNVTNFKEVREVFKQIFHNIKDFLSVLPPYNVFLRIGCPVSHKLIEYNRVNNLVDISTPLFDIGIFKRFIVSMQDYNKAFHSTLYYTKNISDCLNSNISETDYSKHIQEVETLNELERLFPLSKIKYHQKLYYLQKDSSKNKIHIYSSDLVEILDTNIINSIYTIYKTKSSIVGLLEVVYE